MKLVVPVRELENWETNFSLKVSKAVWHAAVHWKGTFPFLVKLIEGGSYQTKILYVFPEEAAQGSNGCDSFDSFGTGIFFNNLCFPTAGSNILGD